MCVFAKHVLWEIPVCHLLSHFRCMLPKVCSSYCVRNANAVSLLRMSISSYVSQASYVTLLMQVLVICSGERLQGRWIGRQLCGIAVLMFGLQMALVELPVNVAPDEAALQVSHGMVACSLHGSV